jgi:UDP-glucose 4-epimerase
VTIYGNGQQNRTFCYVDDNTECAVRILERDLLVNDVINIGSEHPVTILELAELIIRITNSQSKIQFLPPLKEGDMSRRQPDASKMKGILGKEMISLEEGLKRITNQPVGFL